MCVSAASAAAAVVVVVMMMMTMRVERLALLRTGAKLKLTMPIAATVGTTTLRCRMIGTGERMTRWRGVDDSSYADQ